MESFAYFFQTFLLFMLQVLQIAIIIRAVLSWFPIDQGNPIIRVLSDVTEPVVAPFRRVVPRIGMFDLSILAALLVLQLLENGVRRGAFF